MDERRDDWRHGVDENLASLNSGQRSQDDKLKALDESQKDTDALIHGETDSGLIGRIEDAEAHVARLMAVVFQDASGTKGLHHDIQMVLEGREDRRLGWGNITKIVVALIMAGLVGRFYSDIWAFVDHRGVPAIHAKKHKRAPVPDPEDE
jgi:hypothetical protein